MTLFYYDVDVVEYMNPLKKPPNLAILRHNGIWACFSFTAKVAKKIEKARGNGSARQLPMEI